MTTKSDVRTMTLDDLIEKYGTDGISLLLRSLSGSGDHEIHEIVPVANDLAQALRSYLANPDRDLHR